MEHGFESRHDKQNLVRRASIDHEPPEHILRPRGFRNRVCYLECRLFDRHLR